MTRFEQPLKIILFALLVILFALLLYFFLVRADNREPGGATLVRNIFWPGTQTNAQERRDTMSLVRVLELVGESKKDWQDAAQNAVEEAARTVHNITGVEVVNWTANVSEGRIVEYKANVKVAYAADRL